jgi:Tol biopolymer transport system component
MRPRLGIPVIAALTVGVALLGVGCGGRETGAPATSPPPPPPASTQPESAPSDRIDLGEAGYSIVWLDDDHLLVRDQDGFTSVDVNTHKKKTVFREAGGSRIESHAAVSPDGSRIAFTRHLTDQAPAVLQVLTLGEAEPKTIVPASEGPYGLDWPVWSPDGTLLTFLDWNLRMPYMVAADGTSERRALPPDFPAYEGTVVVDWSGDQILVAAASGNANGLFTAPVAGGPPVRIDASGDPEPPDGPSGLGFSPDGGKVAYTQPDGGLWLAASDASWRRRVNPKGTSVRGGRGAASFAPDGRLFFAADEGLWVANEDGHHPRRILESGCASARVSPDGSKVACYYSEEDEATGGHHAWAFIVELTES